MTIVTRFAPSPTGRLHVGNMRTALHNWLWARARGGRFLLRIDDTDTERSEERFVAAIRADLAWLGLDFDGEERQSARFSHYEAAFEQLHAAGRVYPAYETAQELDLKRKVLLGRGLPPVYDRAELTETPPEGRVPHWRFRLDHDAPIEWTDLVRGPQAFDPKLLSDPVVRRADGSWLYMLPSAIDDIEMAISHVVRGEDHVSNTALQLQMFDALAATRPQFAHAALLVGDEGKLSKRLGALGVDELRAEGIEPLALVALLARIGTSDPVEPVASLAPLIAGIDFARFGRAPARFSMVELQSLNAKTLHDAAYADVASRLPAGMTEQAWLAVRPNLNRLGEAEDWWRIIEGPIAAPATTAVPDDRDYLNEAARLAEAIDWTDDPWPALTDKLKTATDRRGKALFLPLRRALTGVDHGPDMATLLPLIGRARTIERLSAAPGSGGIDTNRLS